MINFLKFTKLYAVISILVIGIGVFALTQNGLNLAIDFTGGSALEYTFSDSIDREIVEKAFVEQDIEVQAVNLSENDAIIRTETIDEDQEAAVRAMLSENVEVTLQKFDSVGPALGAETMRKTAIASFVAVIGILLYISYTFKRLNYGLAAIGAMLHDFLVLIGMYTLLSKFGAEVDALFITAVLTTMSFSVHDTIVVFDKIREYRRTSGLPVDILANKALTETMVRSVNNSLTIVLMLVPLTFFGGDTLQFFAAALLIGTITGTYSSPFVATPLLVWLEKRKK